MRAAAPDIRSFVEWAVAGRPIVGETRSGDLHFVAPWPSRVVLAVIDGLGHGPEAADAAAAAAAALAAHGDDAPLVSLFQRCHEAMARTRGAVMTVVALTAGGTLEWLGVGNVEAVVVHADGNRRSDGIVLSGGVVGLAMPTLRPSTVQLDPGDVVVLASDGIRSEFPAAIDAHQQPSEIAARLLADYARDTDDALVLAARYDGGGR